MDAARYYVALALVMMFPGVFLYWFSIHPFIRFWRKFGALKTLAVHYLVIAALAAVVFGMQHALLSVEYGSRPVAIGAAAVLLALSAWLRHSLSKQLKARVLTGLPELAPEKYGSRLLTEGIYSHIRHPRYVQIALALGAYALFTNYLATWILFAVSLPWMYLVARIEERELRDRFGAEYEAYCRRVPRFVPRWGSR